MHYNRINNTNSLFLDTETTGLGDDAEIVEIAIIDNHGNTLMDTLVKPRKKIPQEVIDIHGISNEMVAQKPTWDLLYNEIKSLLKYRTVVAYNAVFDARMIANTCKIHQLPVINNIDWQCAKEMHAQFSGQKLWVSMAQAAKECGVNIKETHRAKQDAIICKEIINYIISKA